MNEFLSENCLSYRTLLLGKADFSRINCYRNFMKRATDVILASFFIVATLPLTALIACLIKITSPGPVLFKHQRAGKDGQLFTMYKFRTMKLEADPYDYSPIESDDDRITAVGKCLRNAGLDEIPQFVNVLKGDMSIVGPRPEMEFIVNRYGELEKLRLLMKPGITGLWQINASRQKLIHEDLHYDLFYLKNFSISLDFSIMAQTALFISRKLFESIK